MTLSMLRTLTHSIRARGLIHKFFPPNSQWPKAILFESAELWRIGGLLISNFRGAQRTACIYQFCNITWVLCG